MRHHRHMQHITSNSTGERAKLWRKLRVGHTSKVSTYTVLSAIKIVDVIIMNGYVRVVGSVHEGSSRNVGRYSMLENSKKNNDF